MNYAILAYNHTIHSTTHLKPFEIIHGQLDNNNPLEIELEEQLVNNYISSHREKLKLLYKRVNETNIAAKEKYIGKANEKRTDAPIEGPLPKTVYVKNKQKMSKQKNKYKREKLLSTDPELKTGRIEPQHYNTVDKIHQSNIKRPGKITYKFRPDSQTTHDGQQPSTSKTPDLNPEPDEDS